MVDFATLAAVSEAKRTLGLRGSTTREEARAAWVKAARACHPDVNPDADPARIAAVNAAYDTLREHTQTRPRQDFQQPPDDEPEPPYKPPVAPARPDEPSLSEEQEEARQRITDFIRNGQAGSYFTMHGWAGSGKTTVLGRIARDNPSAFLCTLAGKAADVLRRKTGAPADTIHSIFYDLEQVTRRDDGGEDMQFRRKFGRNDLYGRVVLCDEVSQISEEMADDMLLTGCKIVAVGDPGQLPPVKGQQFFTKPDVTLQKIHRQALDSPIIRQAHLVRLGRGYSPDTEDFQVVSRPTADHVAQADIILCWKNTTRQACNGIMRRNRGFTKPHPQAGEPVLCLKNAADYGVYNGGLYELARDFNDGDNAIWLNIKGREVQIERVRFEGMQDALGYEREQSKFAPGYSLTVHKAQGSEWPSVLLMDEYSMDDNAVQWRYTAITRASKRIVIVKRP